jgi:hypothetical protein
MGYKSKEEIDKAARKSKEDKVKKDTTEEERVEVCRSTKEWVEEWRGFAAYAKPGVNAVGRIMYINYDELNQPPRMTDEDGFYITRSGIIMTWFPDVVLEKAPWANIVVEVHGGCLVFENMAEYEVYTTYSDETDDLPYPLIVEA